MQKPKPYTRNPIMDFHEIIDFIEDKYKIDTRDYAGKYNYKDDEDPVSLWAQKHGYDPSVLDGELNENSPEMELRIKINTEFNRAPDQNEFLKPYLDYWHWLIDHDFSGVSNGCEMHWGIKYILDADDDCSPKWVKEITQLVYDEFKDQLDADGGMEVAINW